MALAYSNFNNLPADPAKRERPDYERQTVDRYFSQHNFDTQIGTTALCLSKLIAAQVGIEGPMFGRTYVSFTNSHATATYYIQKAPLGGTGSVSSSVYRWKLPPGGYLKVSAESGVDFGIVSDTASGSLIVTEGDGPSQEIFTGPGGVTGALANYREVALTPTLDTNPYAAGDVLWDTVAIPLATRANDAKSFLIGFEINDEDDQAAAQVELYFFSANVSLGTFNAAPSISDANARNLLGKVIVNSTDFIDLGGVKVANKCLSDIGLPLLVSPASGTQSVYVAAITRGTPTQTAAGIKLRFFFKDEI